MVKLHLLTTKYIFTRINSNSKKCTSSMFCSKWYN